MSTQRFSPRRLLGATLLAVIMGLVGQSAALAAEAQYKEGQHYQVLSQPVRTRDSDKIEVVELFWYGCPHCYHFEPLVKKWKQNQGDDVDFWRSPAIWNDRMKLHARAFFTAKALGVLDQVHEPLFTTLVVERKRLDSADKIEDLFAKHGVDREKFRDTFNSFGVNSQVTQAGARARSYKITGTPELVVNGKYRVAAGMAGGQAEMLEVADFLVKKERAAQAGGTE